MISNLLSLAKVLELELLVSEVINCFVEAILSAWIRVHVLFFSLLYSHYLSLWPNPSVMRLDRTFLAHRTSTLSAHSHSSPYVHTRCSPTLCAQISVQKTESKLAAPATVALTFVDLMVLSHPVCRPMERDSYLLNPTKLSFCFTAVLQ